MRSLKMRKDADFQDLRRLRPQPVSKFFVETLLLLVLISASWFLRRWLTVARLLLPDDLGPFSAMLVAIATFSALAYYGTSYVITPGMFFIAFFRPFLKQAKNADIPRPKLIIDPSDKPAFTPDRILQISSSSATKLALRMERRTNTHLLLGVGMGLLGLLVWYLSFFSAGGITGKLQDVPVSVLLWQGLPRVTILLFIELLAGFFLRQYRIGVEDMKYFLELERRAEGRRVAYMIFEETNAPELKQKLAAALISPNSELRLGKDETTTTLQAMATEKNIALEALSLLSNHLTEISPFGKKEKEQRKEDGAAHLQGN